MEELRAIRATGRAFDREEFQQGFCRVAAPVFGAGGDVLGAIGVSVPARRFGGGRGGQFVGANPVGSLPERPGGHSRSRSPGSSPVQTTPYGYLPDPSTLAFDR